MRAAVGIHVTSERYPSPHMLAIAEGLRKSGVKVLEFKDRPDPKAHFCVSWGMRRAQKHKAYGFKGPVLIAEHGYIGDRIKVWTSLGWDGLNGHARFNGVHDPDRFAKNFAADLKPWRTDSKGYALIMGQVRGDASLTGVDIDRWYMDTATLLWKQGWDVMFRPHPVSERKRLDGRAGHERPRVPFAKVSEGSLDDALSGAGIVCGFNSNSLVDAVMAGVPIYAGDRGSMVYDLASRDFNPIRPDREVRLNEIANVQWQMSELKDGSAWKVIREAM